MFELSRSVMLAALAASLLSASVSTQACKANEKSYMQAATCGAAKSEFLKTTKDEHTSIDGKGTLWAGTNTKDGDRCGLICFLGDRKYIMKKDETSRIWFDSFTDDVKDNTTVVMVFFEERPVVVTMPLKEFEIMVSQSGQTLVRIDHQKIHIKNNEDRIPDLQKFYIIYNGKGRIVVRSIDIPMQLRNWHGNEDIRLQRLDCKELPSTK